MSDEDQAAELPAGDPRRPAIELIRHWDKKPNCRPCYPKRCTCDVCVFCGDRLGHYTGRPWPERCSVCIFERPDSFARLLPTGDDAADQARAELFDDAVSWWQRPTPATFPAMPWLISNIARRLDRGLTRGERPFEVFATCAAPLNAMEARIRCSLFCDKFADLELLIVSWCASRRVKVLRE